MLRQGRNVRVGVMLSQMAEEPALNHLTVHALWMAEAVMYITHALVRPIRATTLLKAEIPMAPATIRLRALREAHPPLLTAHRLTVRQREPRITERLAEAIRTKEANHTALRPGLTASRRIALLQEVTAPLPVEAAVAAEVQAVLREVQDNLQLS